MLGIEYDRFPGILAAWHIFSLGVFTDNDSVAVSPSLARGLLAAGAGGEGGAAAVHGPVRVVNDPVDDLWIQSVKY